MKLRLITPEEGPPVWEAPDGVERVLRGALTEGFKHVVLVGGDATGKLYIASTMESAEATLGMLVRGQFRMHEMIPNLVQEQPEEPEEDDGA